MEEPRLRLARLVAGRRSKFVAIGAWILGELDFVLYSSEKYVDRLKELTDHEDAAGSVSVKRAPDPGSLSTRTLPPCASANCRTIESPSPAPPVPRERDSSAR